MPRKDLEWIKEKGLDSEEVIEVLTKHLKQKEKIEEEKEGEIIELEEIPKKEPEEEPEGTQQEEIEKFSKDDVKKMIQEELKNKWRVVRKKPKEGTTEEPDNPPIEEKLRKGQPLETFEYPIEKMQEALRKRYEKDL